MKKVAKVSLLLVLALGLSLGLTAAAGAQPMGKGMGHGPGHMMNLTPEQAGKLFDLKEKFHSDTASVRKQMWIKRAEVGALWKAEKPDQNAINAKQKELNTVRDQLQEKMTAFRIEAKKIDPNFAMGMGRGMGWGQGCGMGPGGGMGMGKGMGPGEAPPPPPPAK
jgi:Spy/CpxP family protein refolding chaperone